LRLDYANFWGHTCSEIIRILDANREREEREFEKSRILNFELANLIAHAHHQPDKIPKYSSNADAKPKKSDEADQARARGALIAMSMRSGI
jgi:hypothetical protein